MGPGLKSGPGHPFGVEEVRYADWRLDGLVSCSTLVDHNPPRGFRSRASVPRPGLQSGTTARQATASEQAPVAHLVDKQRAVAIMELTNPHGVRSLACRSQ
jgi:hypothetical protein